MNDALITVSIVLAAALLWRIWPKRPPKPKWNGKHRLQFVKYVEIANYPDDFHAGWEWKCTCGTGTTSFPFGLTHTEGFAKVQFDKHERLYR